MKSVSALFLILFTFLNCSSDDNKNDSNDAVNVSTNLLKITVDDIEYTFTDFVATKSFDNYEITAGYGNGNIRESFYIRFNQNGVLDKASFRRNSEVFGYDSSFIFPKNTFNLLNLNIDDNSNIIKADFNGKIFENVIDLDGDSQTVTNGSFSIVFTNADTGSNLDIHLDAKVDGDLYESMKHSNSFRSATVRDLRTYSDGDLQMNVLLNPDVVAVGSYDFDSSSTVNKVLLIYNNPYLVSGQYEEYATKGTLVISDFTRGDTGTLNVIKGTFNFTATNLEGEVFNITDGDFLLRY